MLGSQNGHLSVVQLLLDHVSNHQAKDKYGCTALTLASQNGHLDIALLLYVAHVAAVCSVAWDMFSETKTPQKKRGKY